jgi:hypothetical protein
MRCKLLGRRTGLRVSELSLGVGMFGTDGNIVIHYQDSMG